MSYYVLQNDETKGPYTLGQLRSMWSSGAITGQTLYCQEGYSEWLPLRQLQAELDSPVQTIEATGKKWKAAQLIAVLVMIVGAPVIIAGASNESFTFIRIGTLMFAGGLVAFLLARIGAWWHHG